MFEDVCSINVQLWLFQHPFNFYDCQKQQHEHQNKDSDKDDSLWGALVTLFIQKWEIDFQDFQMEYDTGVWSPKTELDYLLFWLLHNAL